MGCLPHWVRWLPKRPPQLWLGQAGAGLTLPICGVGGVRVVERLLALPDGCGQREVRLYHPLLVTVEHGLAGHGE